MLIITGTYPPRKCGVGDYCYNLLKTDTAKNWHLYTSNSWTVKTIFSKCKDIKNINDDIVNIQYPTVGYGTSLLPHFLALYIVIFLRRKLIVTFHEFSQLGWKGKLASLLFFVCSNKIIFTTEFERLLAISKFRFIYKKSAIIKIYSNINVSTKDFNYDKRKYNIGYFGYIRPDKGIEDFISITSKLLEQYPDLYVYIMGQTQEEYKDFHQPLLESIKSTKIHLFLNQSSEQVSNILNNTKIMYLPYPDGLSERRGSFLASLLHRCIIVTTKGNFTTDAQLTSFNFVTKENACEVILNILNATKEDIEIAEKKIGDYIITQVPVSWEQVAKKYDCIINELL